MEKAVQNPSKRTPRNGIIRAERTVIIALNDAVLPGPFVDGLLRPMPCCIGKGRRGHGRAAHGQQSRRQPASKLLFHNRSFFRHTSTVSLKKNTTAHGELWCYVALQGNHTKKERSGQGRRRNLYRKSLVTARLRSFRKSQRYSTVTLLARFRGLSMSQPSRKSIAFAGTL